MFRGMWVDSRTALKGLGATLPRCCDFNTAAVDATGQAYDASGYCGFPVDQGGSGCQSQILPGFSNTTLLMIGGAVLLLLVLGAGGGYKAGVRSGRSGRAVSRTTTRTLFA